MATSYEYDEGSEGEEQASVYIDTTQPVSLELIGNFLATVGRETQLVIADPEFVIELEDYSQGSLKFLFRKRRLKAAERELRENRLLELAEAAERRGKRRELYAAITLALAAPAAAAATYALMDEGKATSIVIEQPNCSAETFILKDFQWANRDFGVSSQFEKSYGKTVAVPADLTFKDKEDLLSEYENGERIDTAGRIMPRKQGLFRTASDTRLPVLDRPADLKPGKLVRILAEVRKTETEVGIIILEAEPLDDP